MDAAMKDVKSKPSAALKTVLDELPVRTKKIGDQPKDKEGKKAFEKQVQEARDVAAQCVLTVLCAVESNKIPAAVKELTDDERDTLMKFIYRGFGERSVVDDKPKATYDCNILLKAHEEISKLMGNGPIIRTIHTRLEV
ncbi:actin [Tritrichomonas foetus]|uniref:Actin-related protein 2/3 complex subunit 5 n=1 Tax=Tritrichomonas foetus TaxID=1144522 RepID=A0A1J4KCB3_9EUKA|nr:actin [Tritrichomonas foetus]|eukprot:OHT09063.1 actin [Tritrichomonas foetus]